MLKKAMAYIVSCISVNNGDGVESGAQPEKIKKNIEVELQLNKQKENIAEEYSIDLEEKPVLSYVG